MSYVILGAGPAGVIAAETLRKLEPAADITVVSHEPEKPYSRMALPYLLAENVGESGTHLRHDKSHFADLKLKLREGKATALHLSLIHI